MSEHNPDFTDDPAPWYAVAEETTYVVTFRADDAPNLDALRRTLDDAWTVIHVGKVDPTAPAATVAVDVRLPVSLHERLKETAEEQIVSVNLLVNRAVDRFLASLRSEGET
jgi:predicted HicB family RNase H-like nuclease